MQEIDILNSLENKIDYSTATLMDAMDQINALKEKAMGCRCHRCLKKDKETDEETEEEKKLLHARLYKALALISSMIAEFERDKNEYQEDDYHKLKEKNFVLESVNMSLEDL